MSEKAEYPESVIDLADEFMAALRRGERPNLESFVSRIPEHADDLREVLSAMNLMEGFADAPACVDGSSFGHSASPLIAGTRIGEHVIIREIGRGGMGVVYEALQTSLDRRVALKLLPRSFAMDDRSVARFHREASANAALHHSNIVPVFGTGESEGCLFFSMQFINGIGLNDVLAAMSANSVTALSTEGGARQTVGVHDQTSSVVELASELIAAKETRPGGPADKTERLATMPAVPVNESKRSDADAPPGDQNKHHATRTGSARFFRSVAQIGVQVADALSYAHQHQVVHRDVKPANILIEQGGHVWLSDFGLAKVDDEHGLTETGDLVGTLRYLPPEAFRGEATRQSDIYSLGLTLYELLAGGPAFPGASRNKLIEQIVNGHPPRLNRRIRGIPSDLERIVGKCIEKEPSDRYASADDLREDLTRFIEGRPIAARSITWLERGLRWYSRNQAIGNLAACLVVVVLGICGYLGFWSYSAHLKREMVNEQLAESLDHSESSLRQVWQQPIDERLFSELAGSVERCDLLGARPDARADLRLRADELSDQLTLARQAVEMRNTLMGIEAYLDQPDYAQNLISQRENTRLILGFFESHGWDPSQAGPEAVADWIDQYPRFFQAPILNALDALFLYSNEPATRTWAFAVAQLIDKSSYQCEVRDRLRALDLDWLGTQLTDARLQDISLGLLSGVAKLLAGNGRRQEFIDFLRRAQQQHPQVYAINSELRKALYAGSASEVQEGLIYSGITVALQPDNPGVLLNHAHYLHRLGKADDAITYLEKVVDIAPHYQAARTSLSIAIAERDGWQAGIDFINAGAADRELNKEELQTRGIFHCNNADNRAAANDMMRSIELGNTDPFNFSNACAAFTELKEFDQALAVAERGLAIHPANTSCRCNHARARIERAKSQPASVQRDAELADAVKALRGVLAEEPAQAYYRLALADALIYLQRSDEARALLATLRVDMVDFNQATFFLDSLYAAGLMDQLHQAIDEYERRAVSAERKRQLAGMLITYGEAERALGLLDRAIASGLNSREIRIVRVQALVKKRQWRPAIDSLLKLDAEEPLSVSLLNQLALLHGQMLEHDLSEAAYRRLLAMGSGDALTLYRLANQLLRQQRLEEAIEFYKQAIALDDQQATYWCNYGHALRGAGRFAEAVNAFSKGHRLGIANQPWRYPSARWLQQAMSVRDAFMTRESWLTNPAENASAEQMLERAEVCLHLGHAAEAFELYQNGLRLEPSLRWNFVQDHGLQMTRAAVLAAEQAANGESPDLDGRNEWLERAIEEIEHELSYRIESLQRTASLKSKVFSDYATCWYDPDLAPIRDPDLLEDLPLDLRNRAEAVWQRIDVELELMRQEL